MEQEHPASSRWQITRRYEGSQTISDLLLSLLQAHR